MAIGPLPLSIMYGWDKAAAYERHAFLELEEAKRKFAIQDVYEEFIVDSWYHLFLWANCTYLRNEIINPQANILQENTS